MAKEIGWSKFILLMVDASGYEMNLLDNSLRLAKESLREEDEDDFLGMPVLEDLAWLFSEFAIIGLWRCVELYRTRAIEHAVQNDDIRRLLPKEFKKRLGRSKAKRLAKAQDAGQETKLEYSLPFLTNDDFKKILSAWGITAKKIRCACSVEELRCLNNAVKHERRVTDDLAECSEWEGKEGDQLDDLESHYGRLKPLAQQYLADLAGCLEKRFPTLK